MPSTTKTKLTGVYIIIRKYEVRTHLKIWHMLLVLGYEKFCIYFTKNKTTAENFVQHTRLKERHLWLSRRWRSSDWSILVKYIHLGSRAGFRLGSGGGGAKVNLSPSPSTKRLPLCEQNDPYMSRKITEVVTIGTYTGWTLWFQWQLMP